jgi:hypothetical protein
VVRKLLIAILAPAVTWLACVFAYRAISTLRWTREHSRPAPETPEFARTYYGTDLKILQFYSREGTVTEGDKTLLCYGVLNAKVVRLDPPVANIYPSLNRCVEAAPSRQTLYTLTAEGQDGRTVSAALTLGVVPDQETLPRIKSFTIAKRERDYTGKWIFSLTYSLENCEEVSIDPPVFPTLHRSPFGSFYVAPASTTTYTLTVTGKFGHKTSRQLTVEVPPR